MTSPKMKNEADEKTDTVAFLNGEFYFSILKILNLNIQNATH
jgi:hypothetical protein